MPSPDVFFGDAIEALRSESRSALTHVADIWRPTSTEGEAGTTVWSRSPVETLAPCRVRPFAGSAADLLIAQQLDVPLRWLVVFDVDTLVARGDFLWCRGKDVDGRTFRVWIKVETTNLPAVATPLRKCYCSVPVNETAPPSGP